MTFLEERKRIADYGNQLLAESLTTGTGGNISLFIRNEKKMLISPSGIPYQETAPEDIVLLDMDGNILEGTRKPSSEFELHRIFYQRSENVNAVVHTHSEYATALACLHQEIPPLHYLIASVGETVKCCKYKPFGTFELAEEAYRVMGNNNGILLGNHGVLGTGKNLDDAFGVARDIEFLAKIYIRARSLGEPVILSKEQMTIVNEKIPYYGQVPDPDSPFHSKQEIG